MKHYNDINAFDIVGKFEAQFQEGNWVVDGNGKIYIRRNIQFDWNSTWAITGTTDRNCALDFPIFQHLNIIPSRCQRCWKVVGTPKNVADLVKVFWNQHQRPHMAKCGIELERKNTPRVYGAYWYTNTIEQAKLVAEMVRDLFPEMDVAVKRGCTEMEEKFPDTDNWQCTPAQRAYEDYLYGIISTDNAVQEQPYHLKMTVVNRWLKIAASLGDKYYLEIEGCPILIQEKKNYLENVCETN